MSRDIRHGYRWLAESCSENDEIFSYFGQPAAGRSGYGTCRIPRLVQLLRET